MSLNHLNSTIPPWLQPCKSDKPVDAPVGPVCLRRMVDSMLGANPDLTADQAEQILRLRRAS